MLTKTLTLVQALLLASAANALEIQPPHGKATQSARANGQRVRGYPTSLLRLDAEVEGNASHDTWSARLTPWAWAESPYAVGGDPREPRIFVELKEGWVERASPAWDLRVGNQLLSWGAADVVNPTDVWNPRDLTDLFESPKLPVAAARLLVHPTELPDARLEIIATPFFRESRLPVVFPGSGVQALAATDSRWLIAMPSRLTSGAITVPLEYELAPASYPATWQAGARLSVSRVLDWDLSVSAYSGVERIPRLHFAQRGVATSPSLPVTITLNPSFHRETMLGLDGEGAPFGEDGPGARFEAAYRVRSNARSAGLADLTKDDALHGVLGLDYTVPGNVLGTTLYANLMYVHYQRIGGNERAPGETVVQGLPTALPWDRNVIAYLESRVGSQLKLSTSVTASFLNRDAYVVPGAQYQLDDHFRFAAAGDLFLGARSGFFGQHADNRRVRLSAVYEF